MPAFISAADITGLAPSADPTATPDPRYTEIIDVLGERVDALTGQFFGTGYEGVHEILDSDFSYKHRVCVIALPRMLEVSSLEQYRGGSWETISADRYRTGLFFRQKWTGIDTLYLESGRSRHPMRVQGKVGWGHTAGNDPFAGDPVPKRVEYEFKKQARYEVSRAGIGGKLGTDVMSGELTVDVGTWLYLQSAFLTFKAMQDPRRLFG